mgnify:CR=1 FL=1
MDLKETVIELDSQIATIKTSAEKCNLMLERLYEIFGRILNDDQKAATWDETGVVANIAQDYFLDILETLKRIDVLIPQLLEETKEFEELAEGCRNDAMRISATKAELKSSIVEMLDCADKATLHFVYTILKDLIAD